MNGTNLSKIGMEKLDIQKAKNINGGLGPSWGRLGGWLAVAAGEIVDIITSSGENLKEAWQNGYEAGRN